MSFDAYIVLIFPMRRTWDVIDSVFENCTDIHCGGPPRYTLAGKFQTLQMISSELFNSDYINSIENLDQYRFRITVTMAFEIDDGILHWLGRNREFYKKGEIFDPFIDIRMEFGKEYVKFTFSGRTSSINSMLIDTKSIKKLFITILRENDGVLGIFHADSHKEGKIFWKLDFEVDEVTQWGIPYKRPDDIVEKYGNLDFHSE